jgi:hypothetical protein
MILFYVIAISIVIYTVFAEDWLIDAIKKEWKYCDSKAKVLFENITVWFMFNIGFQLCNALLVFIISLIVVICCPKQESHYSFNINALKDNLVTEGTIRGSMFGMTGYVDGEISYFFSRTTTKGERIGHIPADKTYIKYDNEVHPRIEVHQSNNDVPKWLYNVLFVDFCNTKTTDYYVIIAPEGTISNTGTYEIDME